MARRCFAEHGYEATTNRMLANEAGITTAAIYHYFDSKLDIYKAVLDEVQDRVYHLFANAERDADTFLGKLEAVYEAAHELNRADVTLARFLGSSRIDRLRDPELNLALGVSVTRGEGFFEAIVDRGIKTGEVARRDRPAIISCIRAFNVGLTDGLSGDQREHRRAVDGFLLLLRGYVAKN